MKPGTADLMAMAWQGQFVQMLKNCAGRIEYYPSYEADIEKIGTWEKSPFAISIVPVGDNRAAGKRKIEAGLVIKCGGFGEESQIFEGGPEVPVPNGWSRHLSLRFWDDDRLDYSDFGLESEDPRILIAGGGDGALQDFCRVLTRKSAVQLLRSAGHLLPKADLAMLTDWETQTTRALPYLAAAAEDRDSALRTHHEAFEAIAERVLARGARNPVAAYLKSQIRPVFLHGNEQVRLHVVFPDLFLGRSYPANQFVAMLLVALLRDYAKRDPFEYRGQVTAAFVEGADHLM